MRPGRLTPKLAWGQLPYLNAYQRTRLADRIEALGEARGLESEAAIAEAAGLSRGYLASLRRGTDSRGPAVGTLLALMTAYDLHSLDALLGPPPSWLLLAEQEAGGILGNLDLAYRRLEADLPPAEKRRPYLASRLGA